MNENNFKTLRESLATLTKEQLAHIHELSDYILEARKACEDTVAELIGGYFPSVALAPEMGCSRPDVNGVYWTKFNSSFIARAGWKPDAHLSAGVRCGMLQVEFKNGSVIQAIQATALEWAEFVNAESAGKYWHKHFKGRPEVFLF